jgi:RNA 2',3'-cyclic 3'-phosphodiesterase
MRTFLALNLDPAERDRLHASLDPLRRHDWPARWLPPAALHLTLRFLGDTEGSDIERIDHVLRQVAVQHGPQRLELGGFGAFPSLRRANVLWVGVAPSPPLMALHRDAELALARLGYGREPKPFRPHITVARLRGGARPPDVERPAAGYDYSSAVDIETMDLMRSHLNPAGAHYELLLRFRLGEPTP